jgi:hypothetical protein
MKRILSALLIFSLLTSFSFAATMKYGQLNVISKVAGSKIYIDGKLAGKGIVNIDKIIAGNHYVKVEDVQSKVIFEKMVNVAPGEAATVVIDQNIFETELLEKKPSRENAAKTSMSTQQESGYDRGISAGYQKGHKDGVHDARITKAWTGWFIWILILLVASASSGY